MRVRLGFVTALVALAMVSGSAIAATALSVALAPSASCSNADLVVSWINTGDPNFQFGKVTNSAGTIIGGFGPDGGRTGVSNYTGDYGQPISIPQPAGTIIDDYAWVGPNNPPDASSAIEFSVVYNCSTKQVLYSCFGPFGSCVNSAAGFSSSVPTMRPELLVALIVLLSLMGAYFYRRRQNSR